MSKDLEVRLYELPDGVTATAQIPSGKGANIVSIIKAEKTEGKIRVWITSSVVEATLATIRLFSSKYRICKSDDNVVRVQEGETDITFEVEAL